MELKLLNSKFQTKILAQQKSNNLLSNKIIKTPILRGRKCKIVEFDKSFITEEYVAWLNDLEVIKYSENRHRKITANDCFYYLQSMRNSGNYYWAIIVDNLDSRHVGNITVYVDRPNLVGDLAIVVGDKSIRGEGIGTEAARLACDWLLKQAGFRKVTAGTMAINKPMLKLMNAIGMKEEGLRKKQFMWNGREVDLVLSAKFQD